MAELIRKEDTLNQGREKLNEAIKDADKAKADAGAAVNTSNQAKQIAQTAEHKADSVQAQFDQVIIEGDSSVEAAAARVDTENVSHPTLKARLDAEHTEVTAQLAQIAMLPEGLDSEMDNTAVLQNALNEAVNFKKKLKIPDGTFRISRIAYEGTGEEHLEIDFSANGLLISDHSASETDRHILSLSNLKSVKITGLNMEYDGDMTVKNRHSLVYINNVDTVVVNDIYPRKANKSGLEIKKCKDVKINGGIYNENFHCGIEYGNVENFIASNLTASKNGETGNFSTGYGIAQASGSLPCKIVQLSNVIANDNTRKGVDCHEFENLQADNITTLRNGISGFSVQTGEYNAKSIQLNNIVSGNQVISDYAPESGLDINVASPRTIDSITLNNIYVENVPGYGIAITANGARSVKVNATVNNVFNGFVNGHVLRIVETPNYPDKVVINIIADEGNGKGVIIGCANHLDISGIIKRPGSSLLLHFPTKEGDPAKVRNAKIHDLTLKGAGNYFTNGYVLTGTDGVITDSRHDNYSYKNVTIINDNGSSFPLWEQEKGVRKIKGVALTPSVPQSGNWVVGDRFEDTKNIATNGYIGRICTEAGSPGTWKNYGALLA